MCPRGHLASDLLPTIGRASFIDGLPLFYLDPPYLDTVGYGVPFPLEQYEKMADRLRMIKGRAIVSLNDHPEIRRVFDGFDIETVPILHSRPGDREPSRGDHFELGCWCRAGRVVLRLWASGGGSLSRCRYAWVRRIRARPIATLAIQTSRAQTMIDAINTASMPSVGRSTGFASCSWPAAWRAAGSTDSSHSGISFVSGQLTTPCRGHVARQRQCFAKRVSSG